MLLYYKYESVLTELISSADTTLDRVKNMFLGTQMLRCT